MVDAHCVRDEEGYTLQWLVVALCWVRVRARVKVYIIYFSYMPVAFTEALWQ